MKLNFLYRYKYKSSIIKLKNMNNESFRILRTESQNKFKFMYNRIDQIDFENKENIDKINSNIHSLQTEAHNEFLLIKQNIKDIDAKIDHIIQQINQQDHNLTYNYSTYKKYSITTFICIIYILYKDLLFI